MQQMRGGFSNEIAKLREEHFASLIELELDFAEEGRRLLIEHNFMNYLTE
jgi:tRNA modification GTPase